MHWAVTAAPGSTNSIPNSVATFARSGTFTAATDTNGLATFTNLGVLSTQGGLTGRLTFTVTSGTTQTVAASRTDVVIDAGTPTTVERSSSRVVSTVVGTSLSSAGYPRVRIEDVANSPVPNASDIAISFSVISGLCTTAGDTRSGRESLRERGQVDGERDGERRERIDDYRRLRSVR